MCRWPLYRDVSSRVLIQGGNRPGNSACFPLPDTHHRRIVQDSPQDNSHNAPRDWLRTRHRRNTDPAMAVNTATKPPRRNREGQTGTKRSRPNAFDRNIYSNSDRRRVARETARFPVQPDSRSRARVDLAARGDRRSKQVKRRVPAYCRAAKRLSGRGPPRRREQRASDPGANVIDRQRARSSVQFAGRIVRRGAARNRVRR